MAVRLSKGRVVESTSGNKYTVDSDLSTGQFAVSYLAIDARGRKIFLKQYKSPSKLVSWYDGYMQYQYELKKRICENKELSERTYEFIEFFEDKSKKGFYQAFEFIEEGKDVKAYLDDKTTSVHQRFLFASLFLYTLHLFHKAGIYHTDLKPDNIYLMKAQSVNAGYKLKLIDFDFPVLKDMMAPWHGKMNYCGTPHYMSPEHLTGKVPSAKSDVFTAALICYELLAQGHPYSENEDEYNEAAKAGKPPKPKFIVSETPTIKKFGELLMRALSTKEKDRPDVCELQQALLAARKDFLKESKPQSPKPPLSPPKHPSVKPKPPKTIIVNQPKSKNGQTEIIPRLPVNRTKVGLSMDGSDEIDWFRIDTDFGKHTSARAVRKILPYLPSVQFLLRRNGNEWFIEPPRGEVPQNLTTVNDIELTEKMPLSSGDVIGIGSRKYPARRVMYKMKVTIRQLTT